MISHHLRRVILWIVTAFVLGLAVIPVIQLNVQKLATDRHWDVLLSDQYPWLASAMTNLSEHWWFWLALGFLAGCMVWGWGWEWATRNTRFGEREILSDRIVPD